MARSVIVSFPVSVLCVELPDRVWFELAVLEYLLFVAVEGFFRVLTPAAKCGLLTDVLPVMRVKLS